jgi:hypothetical protein
MPITNPQEIATVGQRIYDDQYRSTYENKYPGQFVAIEVDSKDAFVDALPEKAIEAGRKKYPHGLFHLIKIGAAGAFKVSYTSDAGRDWIFR